MMDCEGVKIQVSALLDANLDVEQVKEMERHLESCPSCAQFYQEELELAQWLKEAGNFQLEPPPAIWQRIDSQISAEPRKSSLLLLPVFDFRYAVAGLAILILFSLALLSIFTTPQGDLQLLAELESYSLEVEGNPFLSQMRLKDPFFEFDGKAEGNPFNKWRSNQ
ncbi:zf-HC2 domain-containing protein [Acidobacteria bacterium AH-259-D05]|nr:zf-HC2 domain-containing protein [Acidobacteria bacterium AH-259-D05]